MPSSRKKLGVMRKKIYECLSILEKEVINPVLKELGGEFMTGRRKCYITTEDSEGKKKIDKLKPEASAVVYLRDLDKLNENLDNPYRFTKIKYHLFLEHHHIPNAHIVVSWGPNPGMQCEYIEKTFSRDSERLYTLLQRNFDQHFD